MQRIISLLPVVGVLCLILLALSAGSRVLGQDVSKQCSSLGDLSSLRTIAENALTIVNAGDLTRAKARIKNLKAKWNKMEAALRPCDPGRWRVMDKAIDVALVQLSAKRPQAPTAKDALQNLSASLDRRGPNLPATVEKAATAQSAWLAVTDIIDTAEKLRGEGTVLDVSFFEPKDGQPVYAVRTYANGKVWDSLLDSTTAAVIDEGIMTQESELDREHQAEVAALKGVKVTLRQAITSAENTDGGRAIDAGLVQVHGGRVWEILVQKGAKSRQVHVDSVTGKIL
ncbi:PepSY domain-containing protein [Bradyrhizobium genosp. P]|uniref:PepSY domain-containing protein n=1 Tax=Bradyrhizobium genosp. P TaxID=83641 RepID=UPI003CF65C9D